MISRKSINIFVLEMVKGLLSIVIIYFAAGVYSKEQLGYISYASSLLLFFTFFTDFNLALAFIKKVSGKSDIGKYESTFFFIKILLIGINAIIFLVIISFISLNSPSIQAIILLICYFWKIIFSFNHIFTILFQAEMKELKMQLPLFFGSIFELLLKLIVLLNKAPITYYVLCQLIGTAITSVFYLKIRKKRILVKSRDKQLIKEMFKFVLPLFLPTFFSIATQNVGIMIFSAYHGFYLLGIYNVINTPLNLLNLFFDSFRVIFVPQITKLENTGKIEEKYDTIQLFERYMLLITSYLFIQSFIFGDLAIGIIFGPGYIDGYQYLYFFMLSTLFFSLLNPYRTDLIARGKMRLLFAINMIIFSCSLGGWIILIPIFDLAGLILGTIIGNLIATLIVRGMLYKEKRMKPSKDVFIIIAVTFPSLLLRYFRKITGDDLFLNTILLLIITLAILGIFLAFHVIKKEDWLFVKGLFNLRSHIDYISSEIEDL